MTLPGLFQEAGGCFEPPRSIYVHIPFCSSRCAYCDFHSFPCAGIPLETRASYVSALLGRAGKLGRTLPAPVETLYVGGGTPTTLDDGVFDALIKGMRILFGDALREWTVEANPESLNPDKIAVMAESGVTRLSLGIQSLDDDELELLGRGARRADNLKAIGLVAGSGLDLSADLITAIPRLTEDSTPRPKGCRGERGEGPPTARFSLLDSIGLLADRGFGHISLYDLVVEEGTVISGRLERGELLLPDEDEAYEERKRAEELLKKLGYRRYEVSNFAMPGKECLHNEAYWSMNSYLGVGSGAVSTLIASDKPAARSANMAARSAGGTALSREAGGAAALRVEEGRDLDSYLSDPDGAASFSWIGAKDSAFEMVMMGLRTSEGLDEGRFESRFGSSASALMAGTIRKWRDRFSEEGGRLKLDDGGLDLLNRILVDAMDEMDTFFGKESSP